VNLKLSLLQDTPRNTWATTPFTPNPRFNDTWWLGDAKGPLAFCSFSTDSCGEVARALIKRSSTTGEVYPTYTRSRFGSTEIDRLEVRVDLQRQGFGRETIALVSAEFEPPFVALSLNEWSDAFWRSLGWAEHQHPDGPLGASLFAQVD